MIERVYIDEVVREETINAVNKNRYIQKSLTCKKYENAILLPYRCDIHTREGNGGIVSQDGDIIANSHLHETMAVSYPINTAIKKQQKSVIYLGMFNPVWGHCITDSLRKLWFINTEECKNLIQSGVELVYMVMWQDKYSLPQAFCDVLQSLHINIKQATFVNEITQYQSVYIPDDALQYDNEGMSYAKEYKDVIDRIIQATPCVKIKIHDKIYFSRNRFKNKRMFDYGEKRIEDVFSYLGYKIMYPEKLSFYEQVHLLQHCTHFATTEGSTSHNVLFCKEGTHVAIVRKAPYVNNYQQMINDLRNLQITYIDSHLSVLSQPDKGWHGPFFLYVNNNMCDFANLPYVFNNFSISHFGQYVRNGLPKVEKERLVISEFFAKRLLYEMNRSNFCKGFLKRMLHYLFSHLPISILVRLSKVAQIKR
jgi:hypothetical protein